LIVLEDDVLLVENFKAIIEKIILTKNFDCLNFGAGAYITSQEKINKNPSSFKFMVNKNHPFSGGIEGYMMKKNIVEKISKLLDETKISIPFDWLLSSLFKEHSFECQTIYPFLCYQKSFLGIYKSSIREERGEFLNE
jgi:GR25 family glycosyltransferase involved in LPS biosynthesis